VSRAARDQPQHTGMPKRFELFQGTTRCEVAAAGLRDTAARRARRDGPRPGWFFLDKIFRGRKVKAMKRQFLILLAAFAMSLGWQVGAQNYDTNGDFVQTFVGSGFSGYVDGVGQLTMFNNPSAIVADSTGSLFVWDVKNYVIRKIAPDGTVTSFAGGGVSDTGFGTNVYFGNFLTYNTTHIAIDSNDTLWMVNEGRTSLYKITSNGMVTYTSLAIAVPSGVCVDSHGNIYISYYNGNIIYRYNTNGVLSVFAGSGNSGYADGNGIFTAFSAPETLAADAADNIYVWDSGNDLIRRIDQNQNVTTFAGKLKSTAKTDGFGTNASFFSISAMCFDSFGNLILTDDSCIRKISPSTNVVTMAGSFTQSGYGNGAGNVALFTNSGTGGYARDRLSGVCVSKGIVFVADSGNQRIRSITNNPAAQVVSPANLQLSTYPGLQIIGTVGRTYQIQASSDLNLWSTKATILLTSSPYLWIDQNPVSVNKFYRALMLP
jgi:streptogramin lyase